MVGGQLFYYKEKLVFACKQYHKVVIFKGEITFLGLDISICCNKAGSYYNLSFLVRVKKSEGFNKKQRQIKHVDLLITIVVSYIYLNPGYAF